MLGLRGVIAAERRRSWRRRCSASSRPRSSSSRSRSRSCVRARPIGGLYLDQWVMLVAAAVTVWSAVDYLQRFARRAAREREPRVFVTGGSGLIGGALRRSAARARRRGRRARPLGRGRRRRSRRSAPRSSAATCSTRTRSPRACAGCALVYHVAGVNTLCPTDPAPMLRVNVRRRRRRASAPPRAPACERVVHTSSAATLGEGTARSAARTRRTAARTCPIYERSKNEGELAAFAAGARDRASTSCSSTRRRCRAPAAPAAPAGS